MNGTKHIISFCTISDDYPVMRNYMKTVRPIQDLIIRSAAPFAVLLTCNIIIISKLIRQQAIRQGLVSASTKNNTKSITVMLLTVSFVHLVCITPLQLLYLRDETGQIRGGINNEEEARKFLEWALAVVVYYLNHAINFILYCISGKDFRQDVKNLLRKITANLQRTDSSSRDLIISIS